MTAGPTQEVLAMEGVSLSQALGFHLTSRCYPAPHADFYPAIKQAIDLVAEGATHVGVHLPNGRTLTAGDVVDQLRLSDFVEAVNEGGTWA
jgi:hypothetical protein